MAIATSSGGAFVPTSGKTFLGHPAGLFLLFLVEMWERFSYYGMRGILVLYLTSPTTGMRVLPPGKPQGFNPGPGWDNATANTAYGWYTGMAYLTPILGGMIADKFIGTHRSMIVGGLLIALGHGVLGVSGLDAVTGGGFGMTLFALGLALIVIGTGHFKPSVSVMVGQLYPLQDPRRETAYGIFYMGINLGSALQTYIVGTLGERVGWHWGFGAAAVGMLVGLGAYMLLRPSLLKGVGLAANEARSKIAPLFLPVGIVLAGLVAFAFHNSWLGKFDAFVSTPTVSGIIMAAGLVWAIVYTLGHAPKDRGPVATIFIFMLFNAVFWLSFEQAGSSINLFTDVSTDRDVMLPGWLVKFASDGGMWIGIALGVIAGVVFAMSLVRVFALDREGKHGKAGAWIVPSFFALLFSGAGIAKATGYFPTLHVKELVPTTWFQSVNPWLIIVFAPITGVMWTALSRRNANPSQPIKICIGLVLVGLGYLFMVWAAMQAKDPQKAAMWLIGATYFVHTMGEIVLSPTGLSYVTKTAPAHATSLLMGVWFISSFIANLGAGKVAAMVEPILEGKKKLPWHLAGGGPEVPNSQADFFFLFVITSVGAGLVILVLTPLLKRMMRNPND